VEGPAEGSYGIHVAKLAGLPAAVLARARELQSALEARQGKGFLAPERAAPKVGEKPAAASLFSPAELLVAELASLDIDKMTPLAALNALASLKKHLQS